MNGRTESSPALSERRRKSATVLQLFVDKYAAVARAPSDQQSDQLDRIHLDMSSFVVPFGANHTPVPKEAFVEDWKSQGASAELPVTDSSTQVLETVVSLLTRFGARDSSFCCFIANIASQRPSGLKDA